jgi:hypothetical protein
MYVNSVTNTRVFRYVPPALMFCALSAGPCLVGYGLIIVGFVFQALLSGLYGGALTLSLYTHETIRSHILMSVLRFNSQNNKP